MRKLTLLLALCVFSFTQLNAQLIDTIWSENWEGDWTENWYADGGTWELGDATSGPDTAYMGSSCAATVLAGNYAEGVRSRLIRHTKFRVPSADQNPRLRFWHWYSFSTADYGYVQIKTEHGEWQNISSQYWSNSSYIWTYPSLDLSEFADSLVQIAFYFHSDLSGYYNDTRVSSGWYIDNVHLLTGNYFFDSNEGFENGLGDWFADRGTWEVGIPTSGPDTGYLSENCLATVLDGNYTETMRTYFISPPFKVKPASEDPALRFWHWYSFNTADFGEVYIRTTNQKNWQLISNRFAGSSSSAWTNYYTDLTAFADSIVQIGFYFHSDLSGYYNDTKVSSGWYIDEMDIDGIPIHEKIIIENDLAIQWLEPVVKPTCGTGKEQPIVIQVKNNGERAVSNYEVGYSLDNGENFVYETVFTSIDPGNSLEYVFSRKADMADEDSYTCQATVDVVYDIDPTNDFVSTTIENERLIVDIETSDTKCNEASGIAEIKSIVGRQGPYTIYWTSGDEDLKAENLEAGIYFVTITDALGCSFTKPVTINDIGAPDISDESTVKDITCFGMMDGSINIVPTGGAQPYSYLWSNGAGTQNIQDLRTGQYDVTITDSNGCAKNHSFNIEEPAPLKIKTASTDAVCGELNGTAELSASGGTKPYSFKWNESPVSDIVDGLAAGIYLAKVTDYNGCIDFIDVSISEIDAPQILVTSVNPASCGLSDGAIDIGVADPTLQYNFSWSDGSTLQDIENATAGFYSVTVSNEDGSCSTSQIVEIPTKDPPSGEICMISVDSVTGENVVILKEPELGDGIVSTNIYYLSKTGTYQYLSSIDPGSTNTTTDAASNTEVTSYRYRITQVDACANESEPSAFHETMHTVVTPDISLNRANLFWNSYKGIDYNFFQIYRHSDSFGMEIIDTVPRIASKDFYTYTDLNPPLTDSIYYIIVIEVDEACNSILKSGTHNTVRSNKTKKVKVKSTSPNPSAVGDKSLSSLNIFPNPNSGSFRVSLETIKSQNLTMRIFDGQGKLVWKRQYNDIEGRQEKMIDLPGIKPGIYHIQLLVTDGIISRSFIVE